MYAVKLAQTYNTQGCGASYSTLLRMVQITLLSNIVFSYPIFVLICSILFLGHRTPSVKPPADVEADDEAPNAGAGDAPNAGFVAKPNEGVADDKEPNEGVADDEPNAGADEEEPNEGVADDEPNAGADEEEPNEGVADDEPNAGADEEEPNEGVEDDEPNAGADEEEPNEGVEDDEPNAGADEEDLAADDPNENVVPVLQALTKPASVKIKDIFGAEH